MQTQFRPPVRLSVALRIIIVLLIIVATLPAPSTVRALAINSTVDFQSYTGTGVTPGSSVAGSLDSNDWVVRGMSDAPNNTTFGGSVSGTNDFGRGTTGSAVTTGGLYAFNTGASNLILGVQPTGSDFNPGSWVLRVQNNSTTPVTALQISYDVWQRNDQARTTALNFSHSADDVTYFSVAALDFSTDGALDALGWRSVPRTATISGLNIAVGAFYYLRWTSQDVNTGASGARDEIGLDNVSVQETTVSNTPPTINFPGYPTSGVSGVSGVMGDPTTPTFQIPFSVSDAETPLASLNVAITNNSSPARMPTASIVVVNAATGQYRLDLGLPGDTTQGYADITVTVTDAGTPPANATFIFRYAASRGDGLTPNDRYHTGTSDASTAMAIDANYMFVADDEDQVLRLYDRNVSGAPVAEFDFTSSLGLTDLSGGVPREVDIEGSARYPLTLFGGNPSRIYWLGSHSNSSGGSLRPNRYRLFTTDISGSGASATLSFVGRYDHLRTDLLAYDSGNGHNEGANCYGLTASAAAGQIPESPSGFNIEGFSFARVFGTLAPMDANIGFRAPLVPATGCVGGGARTHALVAIITNVDTLPSPTGGTAGSTAFYRFARLDLGGRGIRSLECAIWGCVIVAGAPDGTGNFALYTWTGSPDDAPVQHSGALVNLNPEALAELTGDPITASTILNLVSDNGDTIWYNDGIISKDLPEARHQKFRSDRVALGNPGTPGVLRIRDIQATSHLSPLDNQTVTGIRGIVTGLRENNSGSSINGFFMQEPDASIDADPATSEGILVFTGTAPTVSVGDLVEVSGTVDEFRPDTDNLTITEIVSPTINVISSGNPLPAPIVIGNPGACGTTNRVPPTAVINDDGTGNIETSGTFDVGTDGVDFYESLEGMRVCVNNAVVVGPTNSFGEIWVLGDGGTASYHSGRNTRGGITVKTADFNPERLQLDDGVAGVPNNPALNVGTAITNAAVGIVDYRFDNYEINLTAALTTNTSGAVTPQTADDIATGVDQVTVASYNVENLPGNAAAAEFNARAAQIVTNLRSPDFVLVQEIQDNNGTGTGITAADLTYTNLINAITLAGGPTYAYLQIDPGPGNTDGGAPNGNIRQGILYRTDRGIVPATAPGGAGDFDDANSVNCTAGTPSLQLNPGRIDPTNAAFASSRKPLIAQFTVNGRTVFIVNNHFNSKGGDNPLFGFVQPPVLTSEAQRIQQATVVRNFVNSVLSCQAAANVIVAGDLNDFQFSAPLQTLIGTTPPMTILNTTIANENDRYGYIFEGNSQALDHIVVSNGLLAGAQIRYQTVHVNAEFCDKALAGCTQQVSDHDPSLAWFRFSPPVPPGDTVGAKRPSNSFLYLRTSNTTGDANFTFVYGLVTDVALAGDWNGDNLDTLGFYRPSTAFFTLSDQPATLVSGIPTTVYNFGFGSLNVGDTPVVGDWDGNGRDSVGVYRPGNRTFYLRNALNGGFADVTIYMPFAQPGDIPIAGDWNGDGRHSPGVFRPATAQFLLTNRFFSGTATLHHLFTFGLPGDLPVIGDWDNDNRDGIGVFRAGQFFLRNSIVSGPADITFSFGAAGDRPFAGRWVAPSGGSALLKVEAAQPFEPTR